ncbi:MAG: hypothetical protein RR536_01880 [Anaerovoracaceae bacterium]
MNGVTRVASNGVEKTEFEIKIADFDTVYHKSEPVEVKIPKNTEYIGIVTYYQYGTHFCVFSKISDANRLIGNFVKNGKSPFYKFELNENASIMKFEYTACENFPTTNIKLIISTYSK